MARVIVSLWAASPLPGLSQASPAWLDTFENRLEMLALTQTLNAEILASPTATLSLEKWCRDHKMADHPIVLARAIAGIKKAPASDQLQRLQVTSAADVNYRASSCDVEATSSQRPITGTCPAA